MSKTLFKGKINIDYGQFYFDKPDVDEDDFEGMLDMESAFEDQENGLLGYCHQGKLFFVAGTQSGMINLDVQLLDSEPDIREDCADVVDCPVTLDSDVHLCEWACEQTYDIGLPAGQFIVRYSIKNLDKDYGDDDDFDASIKGQEHIVQLWAGSISGDKVLKSDSDTGRYWHRELGRAH